ncbi:hypothetical protein [Paenibacillus agri]|uniref:Uncharacterized protein n=1 Tax=Paenibacillus agri TaxID=2744309 RepID=A0A850EM13_9BACL|nr:hypothetical protein [Paenibacillus agri]NUU59602.1 hypothetical protein [Paenibacillus agri]
MKLKIRLKEILAEYLSLPGRFIEVGEGILEHIICPQRGRNGVFILAGCGIFEYGDIVLCAGLTTTGNRVMHIKES